MCRGPVDLLAVLIAATRAGTEHGTDSVAAWAAEAGSAAAPAARPAAARSRPGYDRRTPGARPLARNLCQDIRELLFLLLGCLPRTSMSGRTHNRLIGGSHRNGTPADHGPGRARTYARLVPLYSGSRLFLLLGLSGGDKGQEDPQGDQA